MTGFDTYKLFMALNNHFFQNTYDYFKYQGSVTVKEATYDGKRQDEKYRFERLGKKFSTKEETENFIVSNLLEAKKRAWIGLLFGGAADNIYLKWQGRTQSLQYNLNNEISTLLQDKESFNELFNCNEHEHPEILKSYMRGDLSLETFVILDICIGFVSKLDEKLGDDRSWMLVKNKSIKYRPFIERLGISVSTLSKVIQQTVLQIGISR